MLLNIKSCRHQSGVTRFAVPNGRNNLYISDDSCLINLTATLWEILCEILNKSLGRFADLGSLFSLLPFSYL